MTRPFAFPQAAMLLLAILLSVTVLPSPASAINDDCFTIDSTGVAAGLTCKASTVREGTSCLLMCGICSTPELRLSMSPSNQTKFCSSGTAIPPPSVVAELATEAVTGYGQMMGHFWNDGGGPEDNATEAVSVLLAHMPRRDVVLLFRDTHTFVDFVFQTVRYAVLAWPWAQQRNVTWDTYLHSVVPYSMLDEKLDLHFRWRPRLYRLLAPAIASAATVTDAAHAVVSLVPSIAALGVLASEMSGGSVDFSAGPPVTWHSETSPGHLSVQQTMEFGGSCTGTAVVLVAAFRSVGIPARIAGCSQSIPNDDHHWSEFYDPADAGPFGDHWHTKEGVSAGNAGGPWDSPSGPMNGCMSHLEVNSSLNTLWASDWSSDSVTMPTLWAGSDFLMKWSGINAINRCGAYCSAWGCGANQTHHYKQAECWVG